MTCLILRPILRRKMCGRIAPLMKGLRFVYVRPDTRVFLWLVLLVVRGTTHYPG